MRRSTAILGTGLLLVPGVLALASPARPARGLEERRAAIEQAERDLLRLLEHAREDPRMSLVERYLSWSRAEDFASPRREIRVARLLEFVAEDDAPMSLRERARDALLSVSHRSLDPDLSIEDRGRTKRASFSRDRLVPLLARPGEKCEATRAFAAQILESYWHFPDPDILRYNPREETTWRKAVEAYRNQLRGK